MTARFEGSDSYVATEDLTVAVNAAVTLERPLLVKGEPGTGKTELARQVAGSLGLPIIEWHIKVHHARAAGAVRIRRRQPAPRQPVGRRTGQRRAQLHPQGQAVAGLRGTRQNASF